MPHIQAAELEQSLFYAQAAALAKLVELLNTTTEPVELRRIATAILRIKLPKTPRQVAIPKPPDPAPVATPTTSRPPRSVAVVDPGDSQPPSRIVPPQRAVALHPFRRIPLASRSSPLLTASIPANSRATPRPPIHQPRDHRHGCPP